MSAEEQASLRTEFPGYFRDSDETIAAAWDSHLFVFDTNILLNFFRYSETTRSDFEKVISTIQDKVWIPHRVAEEFFRNRWDIIENESKHYDAAIKNIEKLTADLEKTRQHPFVKAETLATTKECFINLKKELEENKNNLLQQLKNDQISCFFDETFAGKLGKKLSLEEENEIIKTGKERYEKKLPPGYLDNNKANDDAPHEAMLHRYGDLIIWLEIIKKSKETSKGIIFILDDRKDDWWTTVHGQTLCPRPELIKEFRTETNQTIYLYTPDRFLEHSISKLNQKLDPETVNEVREIRQLQDSSDSLDYHDFYNDEGVFENLDRLPRFSPSSNSNSEGVSAEDATRLLDIIHTMGLQRELEKHRAEYKRLKREDVILNTRMNKSKNSQEIIYLKNLIDRLRIKLFRTEQSISEKESLLAKKGGNPDTTISFP